MSRTMRALVMAAVAASVFLAGLLGIRFASSWMRLRQHESIVIRQPNARAERSASAEEPAQNIAPFATVTVSSSMDRDKPDSGVADGIVDRREWITREETEGAWIKLNWNTPAVVTEVVLYDRPDRSDNVLGGTLTFDDGTAIPVPALPPGGNPWRINFPPRVVHQIMFRIDRAEGRDTGLEEIMVFGRLNP